MNQKQRERLAEYVKSLQVDMVSIRDQIDTSRRHLNTPALLSQWTITGAFRMLMCIDASSSVVHGFIICCRNSDEQASGGTENESPDWFYNHRLLNGASQVYDQAMVLRKELNELTKLMTERLNNRYTQAS